LLRARCMRLSKQAGQLREQAERIRVPSLRLKGKAARFGGNSIGARHHAPFPPFRRYGPARYTPAPWHTC